jgi:hypothetical protein
MLKYFTGVFVFFDWWGLGCRLRGLVLVEEEVELRSLF